jgi:hypothetical protein
MGELRDFTAELLERRGAAIEAMEPDALEVLAPQPVRDAMRWPELALLGFGSQRPNGAIPIAFEGAWLDRLGALLGEQGRWSERQLTISPRASVLCESIGSIGSLKRCLAIGCRLHPPPQKGREYRLTYRRGEGWIGRPIGICNPFQL